MDDKTHELAVLKAQAKIRLEELKAQDSAKEVAGLRDVPSQAGFPWDVQWPTQPE